MTVLVLGVLAVVLASLRLRLERTTREAGEALGRLDVIFSRSPVGLGFHGLDGRFERINDRLAEINGIPTEDHFGRTLAELLPDLPEAHERIMRVAETGVPEVEVELSGETPARPGVEREWVASYWPVRSDGAPVGVGTVVFEVTERRAAERALRTQTDRYETLLTALSEVGEGMVVLEDGRCVYANPAFEQLSGYAFPELAAMESVFDLVAGEERDEARRRARLRLERDVIDATYQVQIRRRDGAAVLLELAGVPLEIAGPPPRQQLVVVVRDATARARAEAERERLLARAALMAEASSLFDQSLDEERTLRTVAELCVRDLADGCSDRPSVAAGHGRVRSSASEPRSWKPPAAIAEVLRSGVSMEPDHGLVVVPLQRARARAGRARRGAVRDRGRRRAGHAARTSAGGRRSRSTTRGSTPSARRSRRRSSAPCSRPTCR